MEGHAQQFVERFSELTCKDASASTMAETPCMDDHQFDQEDLNGTGEPLLVCAQVVVKCLYLARIGRPHWLSTVNMLARSVTKWNKARDKRLERFTRHSNHTKKATDSVVVREATIEDCKLGSLQGAAFAGDFVGFQVSATKLSSQFLGCARSKALFLTGMPSLKSCRWTQD